MEMRILRKTMRGSVAAIALALAAVGAAAVTAPLAAAQQTTDNKAFADAYMAAKGLVESRKYNDAIPKMEQAATLAKSNQEKVAAVLMRVQVYGALRKWPELISAIEAHKAMGGLSAAQQRNYKEVLAGAYGQTRQMDKSIQLTKELIAETGGNSTQLAYVGSYALGRNQFSEAESYGLKAIEKAKAEGKKPDVKHYNMVLAAYQKAGKMDQYYSLLEKAAPMFNQEVYWRPFVERAKKEPKFRPNDGLLDVYFALEGTKVRLDPKEAKEMGEFAVNGSLPIDGERVLAPLVKSGDYGGAKDPMADRNKRYFERAQLDAKALKAGGLAKAEAEAATKATGLGYVLVGQSYMALGDHKKAIDAINKGLEKGSMEPGVTELAKLRLGIAQFHAGQKEEARKTWSTIKADNGAAWLAKVWTAKSRV
jgi:tetratricopeptide (TPR) repeat protein